MVYGSSLLWGCALKVKSKNKYDVIDEIILLTFN